MDSRESNAESSVEARHEGKWVFRCPECERLFVDPPAPVSTCFDGHSEVEVECINVPEGVADAE